MKRLRMLLIIFLAFPLSGCVVIGVPGGDLSRELSYRYQFKSYYDEQARQHKVCRWRENEEPICTTESHTKPASSSPPA